MADHPVAVLVGDLLLQALDLLVLEFHHLAGFGADHMVVVFAVVDFVDRGAIVEIVPLHQAGGLELGQYPVNRGDADILAGFDQRPVDILGGQVALVRGLQYLENLHPGMGDFESRFAQFLIFSGHRLRPPSSHPLTEQVLSSFARATGTPKMRLKFLTTVLLSATVLAGCTSLKFPGVHRVEVQQGNIITQDMIDQLKPGMSRSQVRYIMGTPLISDTFHQDRWDYFYSIRKQDGTELRERVTIYFDDSDRLTHMTGDYLPAGALSQNEGE